MIKLPINKWTLQFQNEEYEQQFQDTMNINRLKHFRWVSSITLTLCIFFLIQYIQQGTQNQVIIMFIVTIAFIVLGLLITTKIQKQLQYFYFILFVLSIAIPILVVTTIKDINFFLYGFSSSTISVVFFQYSHFKIRMLALLIVPSIQAYFMEAYTVQNYPYLILAFTSQILVGFYSHHSEEVEKSAFAYNLLNEKQKELLMDFVSYSVLAVSLNPRTQQFVLEYHNKQCQEQLGISDNKNMIENLRSIYVFQKNQLNSVISDLQNLNLQKSGDISTRRMYAKQQTLEECAYHIIKENKISSTNSEKQIYEYDAILQDQQTGINKKIMIDIRKMIFGRQILFILIREEKIEQERSRTEEQIKYLNKIIIQMMTQLRQSWIQLFNLINQLKITEKMVFQLQSIKCLNRSLLNQFQNYYVFINQTKINSEIQSFKVIDLKNYLDNIEPFFKFTSNSQNKNFIIQMNVEDQQIKINTKLLSQILINVYEKVNSLANKNSQITLSITSELNLNPLCSEQNMSYHNSPNRSFQDFGLDFIRKVHVEEEQAEIQKLIKFEFKFYTKNQIDLDQTCQLIMNPQSYEEFVFNNNQEFLITIPVTNFLLQRIGPYNYMQTNQQVNQKKEYSTALIMFPSMIDLVQSPEVFENSISFYIYTDQTQLTASFLRHIQQKSFLDF